MNKEHYRAVCWVIFFVGITIGTFGWVCALSSVFVFSIHPEWFEVAGFIMVVFTAAMLKLTEQQR